MALSATDKLRLRQGATPRYVPSTPSVEPRKAPLEALAEPSAIKEEKPLNEAYSTPEDVPAEVLAEEPAAAAEEPVMFSEESIPEGGSEEEAAVLPKVPVEASAGIRYQRLPSAPPRPKAVSQAKDVKPLSLRVPASLVDMCKRSSGDTAVANSNAVAAFLYAFRDKAYDGIIDYSDISDGIAAFSRTFDVAKERAEFNKRVTDIDRRVRQVSDTQMQLLWSVLYLVWDAAGFRTDHPEDPSDVEFNQDPEGFEILMQQLDKAVSEFAGRVKRKEGRPIR